MQQDGVGLGGLFALVASDPDAASALGQAAFHGRWWFWPMLAALALGAVAQAGGDDRRRRGAWLLAGGALGLIALVAQALAVGLRGWRYAALEGLFGELADRQFGVGLGAVVAFAGFLFMTTEGLALRGFFGGDRFVAGAVGTVAVSIVAFTVWPVATMLSQALTAPAGTSVAAAFVDRFAAPKIWSLACVWGGGACGVAWNTLALALTVATSATLLGLCFALIVVRTGFRAKRLARALTVLPIITPPFVIGLGLILIFGRSGAGSTGSTGSGWPRPSASRPPPSWC
jgi:iron(III) transport system permease protein